MGDEWKKEYSSSSEIQAKGELGWMLKYSPAKEYLLVARSPRSRPLSYDPDLNDHIPF